MPKVLIVDDDENNRQVVCDALEGEEGYQLVEAVDGEDCLRKADATFDLILLDVMMPGIDGIDALRQLKAAEATRNIPVIMVTALNMDSQVTACLDEGACDHVAKPFSGMVLRARVRAALRLQSRGPAAREPARPRGKLLALLGAKGGVGTTTIALNVAARLTQVDKTVSVCELHPEVGSLALQLGLNPQHDAAGLFGEEGALISRREVEQRLLKHVSGLRALLGPFRPEAAQEAATEWVPELLQALRETSEYTILDVGVGCSDFRREVLCQVDQVVLVLEQEPCAFSAALQKLSELESIGVHASALAAVVNNRVQLPMPAVGLNDLREQLRCELVGVIPADPEGCCAAVKVGMPIVRARPESTATGALNALANRLCAESVAVPSC